MDRHSKLSGVTEQVALDSGTMISVKMPVLVPGQCRRVFRGVVHCYFLFCYKVCLFQIGSLIIP